MGTAVYPSLPKTPQNLSMNRFPPWMHNPLRNLHLPLYLHLHLPLPLPLYPPQHLHLRMMWPTPLAMRRPCRSWPRAVQGPFHKDPCVHTCWVVHVRLHPPHLESKA